MHPIDGAPHRAPEIQFIPHKVRQSRITRPT